MNTQSVVQRCSVKKDFLKNFANRKTSVSEFLEIFLTEHLAGISLKPTVNCLIGSIIRNTRDHNNESIKNTLYAKEQVSANYTLRKKCPNTELFLVSIFLYSD